MMLFWKLNELKDVMYLSQHVAIISTQENFLLSFKQWWKWVSWLTSILQPAYLLRRQGSYQGYLLSLLFSSPAYCGVPFQLLGYGWTFSSLTSWCTETLLLRLHLFPFPPLCQLLFPVCIRSGFVFGAGYSSLLPEQSLTPRTSGLFLCRWCQISITSGAFSPEPEYIRY